MLGKGMLRSGPGTRAPGGQGPVSCPWDVVARLLPYTWASPSTAAALGPGGSVLISVVRA